MRRTTGMTEHLSWRIFFARMPTHKPCVTLRCKLLRKKYAQCFCKKSPRIFHCTVSRYSWQRIGVQLPVIRTFQPGDIFLLQRLQRQATKFCTVQSLLTPHSALWTATAAAFLPMLNWSNAVTYVLRQEGNGVDRAGFLQAQHRPGRPEDDLLLLAPALETRTGHPAIWLKLLAHYINITTGENAVASAGGGVQRIYADVPDQPLLVQTFNQVGFAVYARQTIWRLHDWSLTDWRLTQHQDGRFPQGAYAHTTLVRPTERQDEWSLQRLYALATPRKVQLAEGVSPVSAAQNEPALKPPILAWWYGGEVTSLLLEERGDVRACLRIVVADQGVWLQIWGDTLRMEAQLTADLIGKGLRWVQERVQRHLPVYTSVRDYQGGLGPVLADFGFAPVMDHAKMVKQMVQRAVDMETVRSHSVEVMPEAIATFRAQRPHRGLAQPVPRVHFRH